MSDLCRRPGGGARRERGRDARCPGACRRVFGGGYPQPEELDGVRDFTTSLDSAEVMQTHLTIAYTVQPESTAPIEQAAHALTSPPTTPNLPVRIAERARAGGSWRRAAECGAGTIGDCGGA
jgi:hypothetical protein